MSALDAFADLGHSPRQVRDVPTPDIAGPLSEHRSAQGGAARAKNQRALKGQRRL
jgi:hypothetical protein